MSWEVTPVVVVIHVVELCRSIIHVCVHVYESVCMCVGVYI